MDTTTTSRLINRLPKAELHLHIEGTLEPEMMFELAARNRVAIPYPTVDATREAYSFNNLQEFLDIYYAGSKVLLHEQDFYDLTMAYLLKAKNQNIVHAEIFFDPQAHTPRGVDLSSVIKGITIALEEGKRRFGISWRLILCFLRHLSEQSAFETLEAALPYRQMITGVGLDSSEKGHPPAKFERVFARARKEGFRCVAHAGEEGPAQNVFDAINLLAAERIDHGVRAIDNPELVKHLADKQIALTMCPLSNQKLQVTPNLADHPLKVFFDKGVLVTVNSDDPAYFGGYLNENYLSISSALNLGHKEIKQLAINSFIASFLDPESKRKWISEIENISD